jgi:hypothetical protein
LCLPVFRAGAASDAVRPENGLQPCDVGCGTDRGVRLNRMSEGGPGLAAVAAEPVNLNEALSGGFY